MEIHTQSEIVLREGGYDTWQAEVGGQVITCFESQSVAGFIHVFDTCGSLLDGWRNAQQAVLNRYAAALRPTGVKAWNVYSVFLTPETGTVSQGFEIERIEEDFTLTRKIARSKVTIAADVSSALQPLLPIAAWTDVAVTDYQTQLRKRLSEIDEKVTVAFLGNQPASEVAALLVDVS
jgi:hypothetical protein